MININIQKIPTGLKIILREVGPPDCSAAIIRSGKQNTVVKVNSKVLSLDKNFMIPLFFVALETQIYNP